MPAGGVTIVMLTLFLLGILATKVSERLNKRLAMLSRSVALGSLVALMIDFTTLHIQLQHELVCDALVL